MPHKDKEFFECLGEDHILVVEREEWDNPDEFMLAISMWNPVPSPNDRFSLRARIREGWRAFRIGQPYSEYVMIDEDETRRLRDVLTKFLDRE